MASRSPVWAYNVKDWNDDDIIFQTRDFNPSFIHFLKEHIWLMAEKDIGSFPKVTFQKNIRVSIERGKGKTSKSRGKKVWRIQIRDMFDKHCKKCWLNRLQSASTIKVANFCANIGKAPLSKFLQGIHIKSLQIKHWVFKILIWWSCVDPAFQMDHGFNERLFGEGTWFLQFNVIFGFDTDSLASRKRYFHEMQFHAIYWWKLFRCNL